MLRKNLHDNKIIETIYKKFYIFFRENINSLQHLAAKNIKLKRAIGKCDRPKSVYAPNLIIWLYQFHILHLKNKIKYDNLGVNIIILEMVWLTVF